MERAGDPVELEALLPQVSGIAHGEAGPVERAILIPADVHAVEGDVRRQGVVKPGGLRADFPVADRFRAENTAGRIRNELYGTGAGNWNERQRRRTAA